jgi:Xaa-Pro aminopeptidase
MMTINERLAVLRQRLKSQELDAYIVPTGDPHSSEYPADKWKSRDWIAPFTGSMGYAVITHQHAQIWTDSRYFLQCEAELQGTEFVLCRQKAQGAPEHVDWLVENLETGSRIGGAGSMFSVSQVRAMQAAFGKKSMDFVTGSDLIADIRIELGQLPTLLDNPIFEHPVKFAGKSRTDKIADVRAKMKAVGANLHLVSTLDDIGWLLNLRGSDVECNPVFVAYLLVGTSRCDLFINPNQLPDDLKQSLEAKKIFVQPYNSIGQKLSNLSSKDAIAVDAGTLNFELYSHIRGAKIIEAETWSSGMKAVKNTTEQAYLRKVMVKDGVALTKAFMWLEKALTERTVTEYEMASMIAQFRSDQADYFGESFHAIIGYQANGALNHYRPDAQNSAEIERKGILLLDSGGQYADGTTDITRTLSLDGKPTDEQKRNFTLVLKGHISLAMVQFPEGTKGIQLDTLARMHLWQQGLNYGHGTGHGVGFFMNVHEPPQGFTPLLSARGTTPHVVGMYSSNEPGFYKEGEFGIRIENLMLVQNGVKTDFGQFLVFETITLFPIDTTLVDVKLLSKEERTWLNQYHASVYKKLAPKLNEYEKAWLKAKCQKV